MEKYQEKLNIVDENDNAIGQETRENIHKRGLLHREIHVLIYNENTDILFQRRAPDKDTFPNLLDMSVDGHVDLNEDYEKAAARELKEETGIVAKKEAVIFLRKIRTKHYDPATNNTNNIFRAVYAYKFKKDAVKLKIERGQATSLEFWPLQKIFNLTDEQKTQFMPFDWEKVLFPIFKQIQHSNKN